MRPTTKGVEKPPDPKVRAPALDPTLGGWGPVMAPGYPTGGDFNCSESEKVTNGNNHTPDPPSR